MLAKPKYINNDNISLIVVINGPDATAGSIFKLFINKGTSAPAKVATISAIFIDKAVTKANDNPVVKS